MTRMQAECAAYAANGDKERKRQGQFIAHPPADHALLTGWRLGVIKSDGRIYVC